MVEKRGRSDLKGICASSLPRFVPLGRSILMALLLVPAGLAIPTPYRGIECGLGVRRKFGGGGRGWAGPPGWGCGSRGGG